VTRKGRDIQKLWRVLLATALGAYGSDVLGPTEWQPGRRVHVHVPGMLFNMRRNGYQGYTTIMWAPFLWDGHVHVLHQGKGGSKITLTVYVYPGPMEFAAYIFLLGLTTFSWTAIGAVNCGRSICTFLRFLNCTEFAHTHARARARTYTVCLKIRSVNKLDTY